MIYCCDLSWTSCFMLVSFFLVHREQSTHLRWEHFPYDSTSNMFTPKHLTLFIPCLISCVFDVPFLQCMFLEITFSSFDI